MLLIEFIGKSATFFKLIIISKKTSLFVVKEKSGVKRLAILIV